VTVSIMSQYMPMHRASRIPLLSRKITVDEHETVLQLLTDLGIENGWVQEMGAAEEYLPDFEREGHPFSDPTVIASTFPPVIASPDLSGRGNLNS